MTSPGTTGTTGTTGTAAGGTRSRTILATRPLGAWRTIDLIGAAFLGVALGVVFWGWTALNPWLSGLLGTAYPPIQGLLIGGWLLGGVVGGLVVRRPGAALFVELVAAVVEALLGSHFGIGAVYSGLLQGLGAELAFALLAYRRFGLGAAMLAGALSVPFEMVYERFSYWADWDMSYMLQYSLLCALSGAVIAGVGGYYLVRALATAGALRAFPAGQEAAEARLAGTGR